MGKVKDYQYTLISEIEGKSSCNIYGVVALIRQQEKNTELFLQDESGTVKVTVDSTSQLLTICEVKDILRIHRAWLSGQHETVIDLRIGRGGTHVILWNSEESSKVVKEKYSSSANFTFTECDENRVQTLRTFGKTISGYFPDPAIERRKEFMLHSALSRLKEHPRPLSKEMQHNKNYEKFEKFKVFESLGEMSVSHEKCPDKTFFSCFAQIISVQNTRLKDCVVLTVWDGTELRFTKNPGRILPSELRDICSSGGPVVSEAVSKLSVDVFCFGTKNCDMCHALKFGDVVLLGVAGFITYNRRVVLALQSDGNSKIQRGDLVKVPDESEFGFKCRSSYGQKLDSLLTLLHQSQEGAHVVTSTNSKVTENSFFRYPVPPPLSIPSPSIQSVINPSGIKPQSILKQPKRSLSYDSFLDGPSTVRDIRCPAPKKNVSFAKKTVPCSRVPSSELRKQQSMPILPINNAWSADNVPAKQRSTEIEGNINIKREVDHSESEDSFFAHPLVPQPRVISPPPPSLLDVKSEPLIPKFTFKDFEDSNAVTRSHASSSMNQISHDLPPPAQTSGGTFPLLPSVKKEIVATSEDTEHQPAVSSSVTVKKEPSSHDDSFVFPKPSDPSSFAIICGTNTSRLEPPQQILLPLPSNIKREAESEDDSGAHVVTSTNSKVTENSFFRYPVPPPLSIPSPSIQSVINPSGIKPQSILKQPKRSLSYDSFLDGPSTVRDIRCPAPKKNVSFAKKTVPCSRVPSSELRKQQSMPILPINNAWSADNVPAKQRSTEIEGNINIKREVDHLESEDSFFAHPLVPQPRVISPPPPSLLDVKSDPLIPKFTFKDFEDSNAVTRSHASSSMNQISHDLPPPAQTSGGTFPLLPSVKKEIVATSEDTEHQPAVSSSVTVKKEPSSHDDSFVFPKPSDPSSFVIICGTNTSRLEPPQQILLPLPSNIKREAESEDDSVFLRSYVPPTQKSSRLAKAHQTAAIANISNTGSPERNGITERKRKLSDENACPQSSRNERVDMNRNTNAIIEGVSTSHVALGSSSNSIPPPSSPRRMSDPKTPGVARRRSILKRPQRSLSHDSFLDGPSTSGAHRLSIPSKRVRFDAAHDSSEISKAQHESSTEFISNQPSARVPFNEDEVVPDSQDMPSTSGISLFDSRNPTMSFLLHMVRWKTLAKSAEKIVPFEISIDEEASRIMQRAEGDEFLIINWFPISKDIWFRLFPKTGTKIVWTGYCPICNSEPRLPTNSEDHRICLVCREAGQIRNKRIFKCKIVIPFKCAEKYLLFYVNIDDVLRGIGRESEDSLLKYQQEENIEELINIVSSYEVQFNTATVNRKKPSAMHLFASNPQFRLPSVM